MPSQFQRVEERFFRLFDASTNVAFATFMRRELAIGLEIAGKIVGSEYGCLFELLSEGVHDEREECW